LDVLQTVLLFTLVASMLTPPRTSTLTSFQNTSEVNIRLAPLLLNDTKTKSSIQCFLGPNRMTTGSFIVKTSGPRDGNCEWAESNVSTLTVKKAPSTITVAISKTEFHTEERVIIYGSIDPPHEGIIVTLIYIKPDGANLTRGAITDSDGNFKERWFRSRNDGAGNWSIIAKWDGDLDHEGAASSPFLFTVLEAPPPQSTDAILMGLLMLAILIIITTVIVFRRSFIDLKEDEPIC